MAPSSCGNSLNKPLISPAAKRCSSSRFPNHSALPTLFARRNVQDAPTTGCAQLILSLPVVADDHDDETMSWRPFLDKVINLSMVGYLGGRSFGTAQFQHSYEIDPDVKNKDKKEGEGFCGHCVSSGTS